MLNWFYDFLTDDLKIYIYHLILNQILYKIYFNRSMQKIALTQIVLNIDFCKSNLTNEKYIYPIHENNKYVYLIEKCSRVISKADDIEWWKNNLIRPYERGIKMSQHKGGYLFINYYRIELACDTLINKLNLTKLPKRISQYNHILDSL